MAGRQERTIARPGLASLSEQVPRRKKVVTMTKSALAREYIAVHYLPIAVLLGTFVAVLFLPNVYQLTVPVVALGVGIFMRPKSVPAVWATVYAVLLVATIGALALGRELPKMPDANQAFAPAELLFTALLLFLYLAIAVLPALWIGRWIGNELVEHRHQEASPA
jgi:hypothetical protein